MLLNRTGGNLVQNGGFEQGLASWLGVENVGLSSPICHQGLVAAAMGKPDAASPASMFQDVPVCPGRTYRLELCVAGSGSEPPDLMVEVQWVLPCCDLAPATGCFPLIVRGCTTGPAAENAWKTAVAYTETVPAGVDTARICLRTCGNEACGSLLIDDCQFAERD